MSAGPSVAAANSMLDFEFVNGDKIELHTADPGAAGTTAVAGNNTTKTITWNAASGGQKSNSVALSWTSGEVDTAEDYTFAVIKSAGGTFKGSGPIGSNPVSVGDTYTIPIGGLKVAIPVAA